VNRVVIAQGGNFLQIRSRSLRAAPRGENDDSTPRKLIIPPLEHVEIEDRGVRGRIFGMSAASRKRLFDQLNQVKRSAFRDALFVTLTYPAEYSLNWREWKRDLQAFLKRLCREYPRVSVLWRLEFQRRGAPHFHLFVFGVRFLPYALVGRWWFEVVGSGDQKHLAAGTEVRRVQNRRKAIHYVAKYMAKPDPECGERPTGRVWGVRGGKWLPIFLHTVFVGDDAFRLLQSVLRDVFQELVGREASFCYGRAGITVYIPEKRARGILAYCVGAVAKVHPPG
jgi:hypothetical protein